MTDDAVLLRRYASEGSQDAFSEFVRRHLPLVFSAAFRRLNGDVHRASDVSQIVFAAVAKDAVKLSRHPVLAGWLYTATRHAVIDLMRTEKRRLAREQEALHMQEIEILPDNTGDWHKLRPVIDEALDALTDRDREVVLLRFFQTQAFSEIGRRLGISEEAARKRVERALDVLRLLLSRRGISSSSLAIATILGSKTIVAAPAGLTTSIVSSAFVGSAAVATAVFMTLTKIQTGIIAALLLGSAASLRWQHDTIAQLQTARSDEITRAAAENRTLVKARMNAEADAAALRSEMASLRGQSEFRNSSTATSAIPGPLGSASPAVAAVPRDPQQIAKLHQRYDSFLKQRGFTQAEMDRWIELMMEKENLRLDLQVAMRELGVSGGTKEIESLRSKLTDPLWKQMKDMLGQEGFAAFNDYEQMSAFRGYLGPLNPRFSAANAELSTEQSDELVRTIIANNSSQRTTPTDLGSTSRIDWTAVAQQSTAFLTPAQQTILNDFVQRGATR